ncbi:MAG: SPFH domain-containing protein [Candidatus Heimdallarchaeota archaeon]|nr:SPFH domain-containing protein [Candidatus Heimdallarchaeota archaeon]
MAIEDFVPYVITIVVLIIIGLFIWEVKKRMIQGRPNEWVLVIKDGKMKKSGIGLRTFRKLGETVVKFPSLLNKVTFKADNVTKELSGVQISGFLIWSIFREDEGPFKAYKNIKSIENELTEDSEINSNLRSMAESIVRDQIANLEIRDVLTQRELVRDRVRSGIQSVVKGFGIWIETVEITDVYILSSSLFEDMQTPFRQKSLEEAEAIRRESNKNMEQARIKTELELSKQRSDSQTEENIYSKQKELEEEREEEKLFIERQKIEKAKIDHEKELELLRIKMDNELSLDRLQKGEELTLKELELEIKREEQERIKIEQRNQSHDLEFYHKLELSKAENDQELEILTQKYKIEAKLSPQNLQKLIVETIQEIYRELPIESVKIVNMGQNMGVEGIIGQIAAAIHEAQKQLEEEN